MVFSAFLRFSRKVHTFSGCSRSCILRFLLLALVMLSLTGCGWIFGEKRQVSGGGTYRPYTIKGKKYYPLEDSEAAGYSEEGLASWYGSDFHGKPTASGEPYNMYAATAAHKILPMGTKVRVTNLRNGRTTVVRINDRGPFVSGRIIDLSRKAAEELDIVSTGTAPVKIATLDAVPGYTASGDMSGRFYVQIGAFTVRNNAASLLDSIKRRHPGSRIKESYIRGQLFWRVQLGTFNSLKNAEQAQRSLSRTYPSSFVIAD